eukprot:993066_1
MNNRNQSNQCDKKQSKEGEYSIEFTCKPFGIAFRNRTPFLHQVKKNDVFIEDIDKNSVAYGKAIIGSKLINIGNKNVEGYSAHKIMSLFQSIKAESLPISLKFRKPACVETDKVSHSNGLYDDSARAVFIDINEFHKLWRTLSSDILLNAILILPNINYEWILNPKKLKSNKYKKMLSDSVFQNLLQWKYSQGLLFTSSTKHSNKKSFWFYLSNELMDLSDPLTFNTTNYNPLKLNIKQYKNIGLNNFRYNVTLNDIKNELYYLNMNKN